MSYDRELQDPRVQSALREAQKELGTLERLFVLGDANGRLGQGLPKNRIYGREVLSDGSLGRAVRLIAHTQETGNYYKYVGSPVVCYYHNGKLAVKGQNAQASEALGLNPSALNTGDPQLQGVSTTSLLPLLSHAVGTSATPSTKIGIKSFRYYTHENQVKWYIGSVASQVDLASYIPSAGQHRYVAIFFNTTNQTFTVTQSTAKSTVIPLDDTDKQTCFNSMPPYAIPVSLWRLADAQAFVTQADFIEDLRPLYGQGTTRHNLSATVAPASTDDRDKGYGIGSLWVNVSADDAYLCVDSTPSSAVWVQLNGGGGFTSFDITDGTTTQTITDGDTITFLGTNYTQAEVTPTDTVTVKYIATPLHIMGW
jgi:hypothetical protein